VRDFCREQIAHYRVPAHIRFVDQFPMTVTGKIQKFVMREQMIAELQLTQERTA
jgi:fatty-acyl-CoA synthase